MKRIGLPTDFSDNSKHAIKYAAKLFKGAKFYLINAYDMPHAGVGVMVSILDMLKKESEEELVNLKKELIQEGVFSENDDVELVSEKGYVTDAVRTLVRPGKVDLIVMGTKGASGIQEVFIGSNTSEMISACSVPVLAVPEHTKIVAPKKIVFASDNKGYTSENILAPLQKLALNHDSEVLIVNVSNEQRDFDSALSEELNQHLLGTNHSFHVEKNDDVVDGITDFVNHHESDMLVMVLRKLTFFEALFHSSKTKTMAMHTAVPLLAVPE